MTATPDTPAAPPPPVPDAPDAGSEQRTCRHCGASFARPRTTGRPPEYCPDKPCAAEAKAARARGAQAAVDERLARLRDLEARHAPALREQITAATDQLRLLTELRDGRRSRKRHRLPDGRERTRAGTGSSPPDPPWPTD
ncbi:hypothetical protein ACWDR1_36050, partial [Streptosporangium sandarakinum]